MRIRVISIPQAIEMGKIKLFRLQDNRAEEIYGHYAHLEKNLQKLFEENMENLLGARLLAHEYNTGKHHPGQIDSLGLDKNNCPVIVEYKRRNNENIITQGLYYLDWLLGHQAEFTMLAHSLPDFDATQDIEFSASRVICVASSFNRFDERAVRQIGKNIELVRYRFYAEDLFLVERLYTPLPPQPSQPESGEETENMAMPLAMQQRIRNMNDGTEDLYLQLLNFAENLGEDVTVRFLKVYIAFARLKNFLAVQPNKTFLKAWLNLDPDELDLSDGFLRDMRKIGHHSSGHVEVDIHNSEDLERVKALIEKSYWAN